MAKLLKLRRGTTTQHGSFTGAEGEVTIDTTKDTAVVHDGSTQGGTPLAKEDMANVSSASIAGRLGTDSIAVGKIAAGTLPSDVKIADANVSGNLTIESADIVDGTIVSGDIADGTIVNGDINASAAIAGTKISPDFGSQDITTTGKIKFANVYSNESDLPSASTYHGMFAHVHGTGLAYYAHGGNWHKLAKLDAPDFTGGIDVTGSITATGSGNSFGDTTITSLAPTLNFDDNNSTPDYRIINNSGIFEFQDKTNSYAARIKINSDGHVDIPGNLDAEGGIDVTGNITVTGTVDGRDVAADGTKLDGIESSATADQTAAEIRTLVESASDSNVFTDADHSKLNGIESGATADQTASEIVSLISGQEINPVRVYLSGGVVGRDSNDYLDFSNNSHADIVINGNNEFRFEADGDFHADGDVIAYSTTTASDENLKENIVTITDAVEKVEALKGVTFKWKKNDLVSAGVIAQDVEKVLPEVVKTVGDLDGGEYKAVNYGGLTSVLIEAIKELSARVKELEAK